MLRRVVDLKKKSKRKSKRKIQKPKKPNGFNENQTEAKKPDNDNEDDNDDDKDLLLKEEKEEKLQQRFIECLNSFNTNAIEECIGYLEDLPYEVIESVLAKTSRIKNPNWGYAKKILDDYTQRKIDSLEKIQIDQASIKNKGTPKEEDYKVIDQEELTEEEYIEKLKKRRKI